MALSTMGTIAAATATDGTTMAALAALDSGDTLARLGSTPDGLSGAEAAERLQRYGANEVSGESRSFWSIVRDQLRSGINILLALAGVLTIVTGDQWTGSSSSG